MKIRMRYQSYVDVELTPDNTGLKKEALDEYRVWDPRKLAEVEELVQRSFSKEPWSWGAKVLENLEASHFIVLDG